MADYRHNSERVNHAVVKMLYRIAVQLKMQPLLYHISIFRTLLAILQEPPANRYKVTREMISSGGVNLHSWHQLYSRVFIN